MGELAKDSRDEPWRADSAVEALVARRVAARRADLGDAADAVAYARKKGLIMNAGHGLHYHNTERVAAIHGINELNIGHAIIARAVFTGLKEAVRDMKAIIDQARSRV